MRTGSSESPLLSDNLMPRGCVQRHTPWTLGVAIYVGIETKTRLNSCGEIPSKVSNLQRNFDRALPIVIGGLVLFCLCAGLSNAKYGPNMLIRMCQYLIIFQPIVPLSIYLLQPFLKR